MLKDPIVSAQPCQAKLFTGAVRLRTLYVFEAPETRAIDNFSSLIYLLELWIVQSSVAVADWVSSQNLKEPLLAWFVGRVCLHGYIQRFFSCLVEFSENI